MGRDHSGGAWAFVQHFKWGPVPVALAVAADSRLFRRGVARAASRWNVSPGASNDRCRGTLEGTGGEARTSRTGCEPAGLMVAYRRRSGPHTGMRERHDGEPRARFLCVPINTHFFF